MGTKEKEEATKDTKEHDGEIAASQSLLARTERIEIKAQPRQEDFLSSSADIAIYGGAAGGGKTWALLLEPLRHVNNGEFSAVLFRRGYPEITNPGGMWDESERIYSLAGGRAVRGDLLWRFPGGAKVQFSHLQQESDVHAWRGAQVPLLGFDQLETFTEQQFIYMLSRNRSTCGVRPYVRATCNPEPGWLAEFLSWWIAEDGYAELERSGKVRWMVRAGEVLHWFDTEYEAAQAFPDIPAKSVTFIVSTIYDNRILMHKDPGYIANLKALSYIDRERLLGDAQRGGNWKVKPAAGKVFNRAWFKVVETAPLKGRGVRFWDFAATEKQLNKNDPDSTASVLMLAAEGGWYILDATNEQLAPAQIDRQLVNLTRQDAARLAERGIVYRSRWEEEGGSSGKRESWRMATMLAGVDGKGVRSTLDKLTRAKPLAAQAEAGNVHLVRGAWNEGFLEQLHAQPDWPHDDLMDAASGAFNDLTGVGGKVEITTNPFF